MAEDFYVPDTTKADVAGWGTEDNSDNYIYFWEAPMSNFLKYINVQLQKEIICKDTLPCGNFKNFQMCGLSEHRAKTTWVTDLSYLIETKNSYISNF